MSDQNQGLRVRDLLDPKKLALRHKLGLLSLVSLAILPYLFYLKGERITVISLTYSLYIAMFAMSWDLVSGYTGELSFGHALFFALGGYGSTVLNLQYGFPPTLSIIAGVIFAIIGGLLIGIPSLRLQGPYLSLVTLIAPLLFLQITTVYSDVLGGELGLPQADNLINITDPALLELATFYLSFTVFLVILGTLYAVTRSDLGLIFYGIRGGEDLVALTGKNPSKFKVFAFVISAAAGGLAGAFFVHTAGQATPTELIKLDVSLVPVLATIFGGMGTIVGAAIGAFFIFFLEESVNQLDATVPIIDRGIDDFSFIALAIAGLFIIYFMRGGLLHWIIRLGRTIQNTTWYGRFRKSVQYVRSRL
jgi:branched-chain amino acid transport system permease protein